MKSCYNWSEKRWRRKRERSPDDYDVHQHNDWIDKENSGCFHFRIHPDHLRRDMIHFDVFHLQAAVTKRPVNYS